MSISYSLSFAFCNVWQYQFPEIDNYRLCNIFTNHVGFDGSNID